MEISTTKPVTEYMPVGRSEESTTSSKKNLPGREAKLYETAFNISEFWNNNSKVITVQYCTSTQFRTYVDELGEEIEATSNIKGKRKPSSGDRKVLLKEINQLVSNVKNILKGNFGARGIEMYAKVGILRKGKNYVFPTNSAEGLIAIRTMISGLTELGYTADKYNCGVEVWESILERFVALNTDNLESMKSVSNTSGRKQELKDNINEVLNSLILIIKGNYPKTYKTELRNWGFLKEKY